MNRHTRCRGVGGVKLLRGVSSCPGEQGGLIHQRDRTGDLPNLQPGGDPLRYSPPVAHPPTKVTRKLT